MSSSLKMLFMTVTRKLAKSIEFSRLLFQIADNYLTLITCT
jgi:hypothetical protein